MDLVKVTDGTPERYSVEQFKRDNPRTGFPDPITAGDLKPYGVFPLRSSKPNYDPATQVLSDTGTALEGNNWVVQWVASDLPIESVRANMQCSRAQGKTVIGSALWDQVTALADDPDTPWGLKVVIHDTYEWNRLDPNMDALIWAMGMTPTEADDLFTAAMALS
tara:strand:+ start:2549 stop:3040 length:492 start_codon:yes stop_codon:yes gene_type:complete